LLKFLISFSLLIDIFQSPLDYCFESSPPVKEQIIRLT
jgi:hypothetical protein